MSKEKQIEEMAIDIGEKQEGGWIFVDNSEYTTDVFNKELAEHLVVNKGYRKQSEGEWKKLYEKAPRYVCTSCNHLFNNKEYKYCPNCGARMKGGE